MAGSSNLAYAIFTPCQQSHHFDDRRIPFNEEQIKIGRAVAKLKPSTNNAIFDCKVLSRNHAVMWYEDGKFFLKDTKSSNGTFVNNQRLSKGTEESPPKEVFSGDIIQFGVEIVENTKKVTHGCIISIARLYYPDGREASSRSDFDTIYANLSSSSSVAHCSPSSAAISAINNQELYQLQQYIKEAVYREQLIESKLSALQSLLSGTQEASENSWRALIDEDRLLSRIEMLEGQLLAYSKNMTEDKLKEQIVQLHEEKERYELSGKEALRRALEEKMEAVQRLADVERSLETTEEECTHLRESCATANGELQLLSQQNSDALQRVNGLCQQLEDYDRKYKDLERHLADEKLDMESRLSQITNRDMPQQTKVDHQINGVDVKLKGSLHFNDVQEEQNIQYGSDEVTDLDDSLSVMPPRTNLIEEKLREQVLQLKKEKEVRELQAKEDMKRMSDDLREMENASNSIAQECTHLRESRASSNKQMLQLTQKHSDALLNIKCLSQQLEETEQKCKALEEYCSTLKLQIESALLPQIASHQNLRNIKLDQSLNGMAGCSKLHPNLSELRQDSDLEEHLSGSDHNFSWEDVMLQARTVTIFSAIPLFVLLIAFVLAFFPFLSRFTATREDVD